MRTRARRLTPEKRSRKEGEFFCGIIRYGASAFICQMPFVRRDASKDRFLHSYTFLAMTTKGWLRCDTFSLLCVVLATFSVSQSTSQERRKSKEERRNSSRVISCRNHSSPLRRCSNLNHDRLLNHFVKINSLNDY